MTKKKPRRYYSLLVREPSKLWGIEFGDYDRRVVAAEGDDVKQCGSWPVGTKIKIIETPETQAEINAAVAELNARIVLRMIKDGGVLEDRLEYDVDMLAKMYGMTADAAARLHHLLHTYGEAA